MYDLSESITRAEIESPEPNVSVIFDNEKPPSSEIYGSQEINSSSYLVAQIRLLALEGVVTLIEQERETLRREIDDLESTIQELEDERDTLEQRVEHKDRRLQQTVENYEAIIESKDQQYQDVVRKYDVESTSSPEHRASSRSIPHAIVRWFKQIFTRS